MIGKEEFGRFEKQMVLKEIGILGQTKLKAAKVAVVGAGGLGCPVLQYLNSMGVGTLGLIDFDTVMESNLHRQILYTSEDIGKSKIECAAKRMKAQNPYTTIIEHNVVLSEENAEEILSQYDFVVDGCDNFLTRYIVNDTCVKLGKPLIYGSILGFEGQMATFNYQGSKNLRDIFPEPPNAEDVPNCSENGVLGSFPGIIGTMMAQETVKVILDLNPLKNQLLLIDTKWWTNTKISY
ncbi:MAG: HesA/MoeB/ThiF family protein [Crocinitomicaceae bacterium]|jgi:molybdopterin-synthase adenylyltransferase|nr:HesA/MoeB/ThiF family protein [Crocinitomicaceae bacterium]